MNLDSLAITHLLAVAVWLFWTIGPIAFQNAIDDTYPCWD